MFWGFGTTYTIKQESSTFDQTMGYRSKRVLKKLSFLVLVAILIITGLSLFCHAHIRNISGSFVYNDPLTIPSSNVGLVLGTVRQLKNGSPNLYFSYRIEAAARLFKLGKVKHFIVSGDNHLEGYDEPEDMRKALIEAGVPDSCISLDYAGFRTLDSIIRCREIFGQKSILIISQQFHNERAIFLARENKIEAVAFNARDVTRYYGIRTRMREYLARVKACMDIYILKTEPKFLGDPVHLPI
jgi:SanA protein